MKVRFDPELTRELKKLRKKNPQLLSQINKQLQFFQENPKHPSLRIHKLSGKLGKMWSLSISSSIRMTYFLYPDEAYFFAIGTHDQVYKIK